jgi:hypothetical protein
MRLKHVIPVATTAAIHGTASFHDRLAAGASSVAALFWIRLAVVGVGAGVVLG